MQCGSFAAPWAFCSRRRRRGNGFGSFAGIWANPCTYCDTKTKTLMSNSIYRRLYQSKCPSVTSPQAAWRHRHGRLGGFTAKPISRATTHSTKPNQTNLVWPCHTSATQPAPTNQLRLSKRATVTSPQAAWRLHRPTVLCRYNTMRLSHNLTYIARLRKPD